jgi:hypothetical protein
MVCQRAMKKRPPLVSVRRETDVSCRVSIPGPLAARNHWLPKSSSSQPLAQRDRIKIHLLDRQLVFGRTNNKLIKQNSPAERIEGHC